MKYFKNIQEFKSDFDKLKSDIDKLDISIKNAKRKLTPEELIEDYFLRLKEVCGYSINIEKAKVGDYMFWIRVLLRGNIKIINAEKELNMLVKELNIAKIRLSEKFGFDCGFFISFNGQSQNKINTETNKNDLFVFQGIGKRPPTYLSSYYDTFGEDEFLSQIEFMII